MLVCALSLTGCASYEIVRELPDGRIRTITPATGGVEVVVLNNVLGTVAEAEVLGPQMFRDRVHNPKIRLGQSGHFFFGYQTGTPRNNATILVRFYSDENLQYLGSHEVRVSLYGQYGEYRSEVFRIDYISVPREVPRY
jgi:hypothetical protein